jgi:ABC-type lipoprotein release transport system permease subunit
VWWQHEREGGRFLPHHVLTDNTVGVTAFVAFRLWADLRHRWMTALGLALLVAVLGGIVLATAVGARRTSSAYDRLLEVANPPELLVSPSGAQSSNDAPLYRALAGLPGVRRIGLMAGVPVVPEAGTPSERLAAAFGGIGVVAPLDGPLGFDIGRPKLVGGRMPDVTRAEEVLVSERFAADADLHVGDHIDAVLLTQADTNVVATVATRDQGRPIRLIVTGIGVLYDEVVPFSDLNDRGSILATAPLAALVERRDWNFEGAFIDAEPGADLDELTAAIRALGNEEDVGTGGPVFVSNQASAARQVNDAMRPLAVALAVAATAIGLVALLVVGQAVARASRESPTEVDALRAIGSQPSDRVAFIVGRAAVVGTAGAVGAVLLAVALSGRFPIGVARVAEPDPGIHVDRTALSAGAALIALLTTATAVPAALLGLRQRVPRPKLSRLATAAAASGLSPAAVQGVRFAVLGGGRRPVPIRTTLVAVAAAITSVFATTAFGASLVALIDTPSRYGQGWDRMVDAQFGPAPVTRIIERFGPDPAVRGIGAGNYGDVAVNGVPVPAFDLEVVQGRVSVGIVEGRPAATSDEIVLGGETIGRLGVRVGDTVDVDTGAGARPMRLTGRGIFPHMGQGSFSTTGLGIGAQLGAGSLVSFGDFETVPPDYELNGRRYNFVIIDVGGSPSALDTELAELEASIAADGGFAVVRHEQPPTKIRDLNRVRVVPGATAGVLALVAVAALAHLLVTSVRERRRELALLRTLGFSGRQLHASVSWHASVIALAALAVGAPLGILLGRAVWRWFADGLYASAPADTPWTWFVGAPIGTLLLANLVAAIPGHWAARTHPAVALRNE